MMILVKDIDALLPQTQCGECSFSSCLPYAEAMAAKTATIDRCPPGGAKTVKALGQLLNIDPTPYLADAERKTRSPALAIIREAECIGCTKCIQACPVDAIVGSGKLLHHVLEHECTGCGLCVEPCPVDCIDLVAIPESAYDVDLARSRFNKRHVRLLQEEQAKQHAYREKRRLNTQASDQTQDQKAKQAYILEALNRVKAKKS